MQSDKMRSNKVLLLLSNLLSQKNKYHNPFFCHVQKAMQNMDVLFTHLPLEKQYLPSFFFRMAMNPMNLCNDRWSLFDDHFFSSRLL